MVPLHERMARAFRRSGPSSHRNVCFLLRWRNTSESAAVMGVMIRMSNSLRGSLRLEVVLL